MFSLLLSIVTSSAAFAQSPSALQVCVQTCQAYSAPGYELRSCVARCSEKAKVATPVLMTPKQK